MKPMKNRFILGLSMTCMQGAQAVVPASALLQPGDVALAH
jgi:hypothetical protein